MRKLFVSFFAAIALLALTTTVSNANEGSAELRSTIPGRTSRCTVHSHLGDDKKYALLVTCRDLIYPIDPGSVSSYVMWGNPVDGSQVIKWGDLNEGRAVFKSANKAFSSIFVTIETNPKAKAPEGTIVMQGSVVADSFLDGPEGRFTPTPTPEEEIVDDGTVQDEKDAEKSAEEENQGGSALKRVSVIIAVVLMIGAIIALVVIQRSKKR